MSATVGAENGVRNENMVNLEGPSRKVLFFQYRFRQVRGHHLLLRDLCNFTLPFQSLTMAFLIKGNSFSQLRSHSQKADSVISPSTRGFHVAPGPREQALLAKDPALSRFKSYKKSVKSLKRVGDVLTIVVISGICYEIYVRATMREEARAKARENV